jgi:hypothetical protein
MDRVQAARLLHTDIMAATVRADGAGELDVSRLEPLFTFGQRRGNTLDCVDVTSDGKRFLFFASAGAVSNDEAAELVLLQN